jgi:hypothetical protein
MQASLQSASSQSVFEEFCLPAGVVTAAKIVDVLDGDTSRGAIHSPLTGRIVSVTVRIAGVDTPETRMRDHTPLSALERHAGLMVRGVAAKILGAAVDIRQSSPCSPTAGAAATGDAEIDAAIAAHTYPSRAEICAALAQSRQLVFVSPELSGVSRVLSTTYDNFGRVVADILPVSHHEKFFGSRRPHSGISDVLLSLGLARPFEHPLPAWTKEQLLHIAARAAAVASEMQQLQRSGGGDSPSGACVVPLPPMPPRLLRQASASSSPDDAASLLQMPGADCGGA